MIDASARSVRRHKRCDLHWRKPIAHFVGFPPYSKHTWGSGSLHPSLYAIAELRGFSKDNPSAWRIQQSQSSQIRLPLGEGKTNASWSAIYSTDHDLNYLNV